MFSRISFTFVVASALLTAATPIANTDGHASTPASQCNVGDIQCCNSVQSASSPEVATLTGLLGAVLGPITGLVGVTCNPISVIGIGGNSCAAQPVCCTNNNFNGVIALGCTPVNLNL